MRTNNHRLGEAIGPRESDFVRGHLEVAQLDGKWIELERFCRGPVGFSEAIKNIRICWASSKSLMIESDTFFWIPFFVGDSGLNFVNVRLIWTQFEAAF